MKKYNVIKCFLLLSGLIILFDAFIYAQNEYEMMDRQLQFDIDRSYSSYQIGTSPLPGGESWMTPKYELPKQCYLREGNSGYNATIYTIQEVANGVLIQANNSTITNGFLQIDESLNATNCGGKVLKGFRSSQYILYCKCTWNNLLNIYDQTWYFSNGKKSWNLLEIHVAAYMGNSYGGGGNNSSGNSQQNNSSSYKRTCNVCQGKGWYTTPQVSGNEIHFCVTCNGNGYIIR